MWLKKKLEVNIKRTIEKDTEWRSNRYKTMNERQ